MFDFRSLHDHGPPLRLSEAVLLAVACSYWHVHESELFAREELQLVCRRLDDGRYEYLRFHDDGGLELFQPRDYRQHPRRVPC
ncbi:MAG: hypothetical protein RLZZ360_875 [Candidatus Parcubacteria bacterium]